jgi:tetratricopeptide (TPR) repeat protein
MPTRIFLCNEREDPEIRDYLQEAEESIAAGEEYLITWNCANVTSIQPGDRAFVKRVGGKPNGYFASGYVVPAEKRYQLRLKDRRFQNLSEAYDYDSTAGNFVVWLAWDSYVDFELPLRTDLLKRNSAFDGALLDPAAGGGILRQQYVPLLEEEWQKHSTEMAAGDRGIRLVDICINLGKQSNQKKDHDRAIEYYCRALDVQPDSVKAFVGLGNAYQTLGEDRQAIADYSDAIEIGSAYDRVAYTKRGISYYNLKDWQRALQDFERAIKLNSKNSEAYFYRAMTFYKLQDFARAIASFDNVVKVDPESDRAFYFRGRSNFNSQAYDRAIADFSQALTLKPDLIESYYYRGLAYSKLGNGSDYLALQDLRLAAKMYKGRENIDRYLKVRDLIEVLTPADSEESEFLLASQSPKLLQPKSSESPKLPQLKEKQELNEPLKLPELKEQETSPSERQEPVSEPLALAVKAAEVEGVQIETPIATELEIAEVLPPRERMKAAEKQAIELIIQQYEQQGWEIEFPENPRLGYKFSCFKAEERQDIEVKGLLGNEITFLITAREVQQAEENPNFILWVVTAALDRPKLQKWSGREMLDRFQLDPMKYLASLNS